MECYILRAEGTRTNLTKVPRLKAAQKIVGGYVELVVVKRLPPMILLVNEEGKLKPLPVNVEASKLYGGEIVGDVVVMDREVAVRGKWL